jgi:hypothetical protein
MKLQSLASKLPIDTVSALATALPSGDLESLVSSGDFNIETALNAVNGLGNLDASTLEALGKVYSSSELISLDSLGKLEMAVKNLQPGASEA